MTTSNSRPLPRIDKDSEPYWASAHDHDLQLQRCTNCGHFRFYPSRACHYCQSLEFEWDEVSGKGEIYSFSILKRARGNPFEDLLPLTVVLVKLAEGPVMMSNLIDCPEDQVKIGLPVEIAYEDVDAEITLPVFRPAAEVAR